MIADEQFSLSACLTERNDVREFRNKGVSMEEMTIIQNWKSMEMEHVGGGDADVFTKSGRYTNVSVKIEKPSIEKYGATSNCIKTNLVYDIKEGRHNHTHLQMVRNIIVPLPSDITDIKIPGAKEYRFQGSIRGQNHKWNSMDIHTVNWIQDMKIKIDGKGDDDEGNAGIDINFAIPITYTIKNS